MLPSPCFNVRIILYIYRDEERCSHCPRRDVSTWTKKDIEFNVIFKEDSALVQFDLTNMTKVGWMVNVDVEVQVDWKERISQAIPIDDLNSREQHVSNLNLMDRVCLVFKLGFEMEPALKLCEIYMDETEPSKWQPKDIELSVSCDRDTATVNFDLTHLKESRWLEVLTPIFKYSEDMVSKIAMLSNFLNRR